MRCLLLMLVLSLSAATAFAQSSSASRFVFTAADNPPNWCRNGHFPSLSETFGNGEIATRTRLISDDDGKAPDSCPSDDTRLCPRKRTIAAGTSVVVSKSFRNFVCVYDIRRATSGWVSSNAVRMLPDQDIALSKWTGRWSDRPNSLTIERTSERLHVTGEALWFGARLKDGSRSIHSGELDFVARPAANTLTLAPPDQNDCSAELIHLGRVLVVRDNGSCGGMNVRFNGVYTKP